MAAIAGFAVFWGFRTKRRNEGYIFTTIVLIAADILCVLILSCKTVLMARIFLGLYYILHAWMFVGVLWTVLLMGRVKFLRFAWIPLSFVALYQTIVVVLSFFGKPTIQYAKHIFLGMTWWVVEPPQKFAGVFNLYLYFLGLMINSGIILSVLVVCTIRANRLFRMKFIILIAMQLLMLVIGTFLNIWAWPCWITTIIFNLICYMTYYLVALYTDHRLRDWSLVSFANEMSDGFVLYNEYDTLIYTNKMIKTILSKDLLDSFTDIKVLEEWASHTTIINNEEVLVCSVDDTPVYFVVDKISPDSLGSGMGTIYKFRNITASVTKFQAMEKVNYELERTSRMKSDFLANMSHEIRTPMNAVIGMAELALREDIPPQVKDYLLQIRVSGRNLLNIINDILDFSKIEAGKMEIVPDPYEPVQELNDIANILETRIGNKDLELFVVCDADVPHALIGDEMRIRQIIINLANNAIKFTQHGVVQIFVSCQKLSDEEVMMTYHVVDTGMGIREEDLDKLFESFQQVDTKRNRTAEGTGLGLAISKRLCEAMGGTMGVKSEYGKGSDFYFSIPQKVIDQSRDLVVERASEKFAYVMNAKNQRMVDLFLKEMEGFGVSAKQINEINDYQPTGKIDYFFIMEDRYNSEFKFFLDKHPDVTGVVLVDYGSSFESSKKNVVVMHRPETTLNLVKIMNGQTAVTRSAQAQETYSFDYTAPEARILCVDDNTINITIVIGLLQPLGLTCLGAMSGKEAIDMVKKEKFDLILMDHMMPEMDGVETTHILRNMDEAVNVPIIALSANVMEGSRDMFLREGMNDFIAKPIDVRVLGETLKTWLPEDKIKPVEEGFVAKNTSNVDINFDCLDTVAALKILGSPDLYPVIVEEYYKSGEAKLNQIQTSLEKDDISQYTIAVHALKSSSRQIGALELGDLAEKLEMAGKGGERETIDNLTPQLLADYKELLQKLSVYFPEEKIDSSQLEEITAPMLEACLDNLEMACDELDSDGMEEAESVLKMYSYPDEWKADVEELCKAIEQIDTEACMELIGKIREKL